MKDGTIDVLDVPPPLTAHFNDNLNRNLFKLTNAMPNCKSDAKAYSHFSIAMQNVRTFSLKLNDCAKMEMQRCLGMLVAFAYTFKLISFKSNTCEMFYDIILCDVCGYFCMRFSCAAL